MLEEIVYGLIYLLLLFNCCVWLLVLVFMFEDKFEFLFYGDIWFFLNDLVKLRDLYIVIGWENNNEFSYICFNVNYKNYCLFGGKIWVIFVRMKFFLKWI